MESPLIHIPDHSAVAVAVLLSLFPKDIVLGHGFFGSCVVSGSFIRYLTVVILFPYPPHRHNPSSSENPANHGGYKLPFLNALTRQKWDSRGVCLRLLPLPRTRLLPRRFHRHSLKDARRASTAPRLPGRTPCGGCWLAAPKNRLCFLLATKWRLVGGD